MLSVKQADGDRKTEIELRCSHAISPADAKPGWPRTPMRSYIENKQP